MKERAWIKGWFKKGYILMIAFNANVDYCQELGEGRKM